MDFKLLDIGYKAPEKKKILVVDDEIALQSLFYDTFVDRFEIHSAHKGYESLELAEKLQPDLIFMDVMLPDISGYEVVKLLRSTESTKKIPVIVITAKDFDPSTVEMLKSEPNVYAFLQKPFHVAELRETVRFTFEKIENKNPEV